MFPISKANVYCEPVDEATLHQFKQALKPEWVQFGALMPDAHLGYSMPIGGVIRTAGVVVPAWVGYDIGCGVCAIRTSYRIDQILDKSKEIHDAVCAVVPVGFNRHKDQSQMNLKVSLLSRDAQAIFYARGGDYQYGTLGGGNHFIEMCFDKDNNVWIVIHSGSRGTGHGIAKHYMDTAKALTGQVGGNNEGNFGLPIETKLGRDYLKDMDWGLGYALGNRAAMVRSIESSLKELIDGSILWSTLINKNHNHAEVNGNFVTHRKGATSAKEGEKGVIPGNMRDGSRIVTGLGNTDSLLSCSHGAGRRLSRGEAKRRLSVDTFADQMRGIVANVSAKTLDESPGAYKNINTVMQQQTDLCTETARLLPIINWKG